MLRANVTRAQSLAAISGALVAAGATRAFAQSATTVRIGFVPGDTYAQAIYAQQLGWFAKAGIDAQLTMLNNAGEIAAAVAGKSLDVATGDIVSLSNAINHGVPVQLIAGGGRYLSSAATTLLCVDKDSPIKTPQDLAGKRIAVITLVGLGTAAVKAWLTQNDVDPASVEFTELPQPSMQPALARGQVQGAVIVEPTLSAVKDNVRVIGKPYDAIAKSFLISEWFSTPEWLAANPAVAKKLVGVIYDTARWANKNPALSLPMLAAYLKLDPERLKTMSRALYATNLSPADIQPVIDVALKNHAIQRALNARDLIAKL